MLVAADSITRAAHIGGGEEARLSRYVGGDGDPTLRSALPTPGVVSMTGAGRKGAGVLPQRSIPAGTGLGRGEDSRGHHAACAGELGLCSARPAATLRGIGEALWRSGKLQEPASDGWAADQLKETTGGLRPASSGAGAGGRQRLAEEVPVPFSTMVGVAAPTLRQLRMADRSLHVPPLSGDKPLASPGWKAGSGDEVCSDVGGTTTDPGGLLLRPALS